LLQGKVHENCTKTANSMSPEPPFSIMTPPRPNLVLSDLCLKAVLLVLLLFLVPHLDSSPAEVVAAVTNVPLAFVSLVAVKRLCMRRTLHPLRAWVWIGVFGGLAIASGVGVIAHGFELDATTRKLLWHPINAALAVTVACFAAGAVLDGWSASAARRMLPGLLMLGAGFFYYATFCSETFLPFILYEGVAVLFSLAVYATLAARRNLAGAAWMTAGVAITMLAAALQATRAVTFTLGVPLDHNGVFHLVQLPGLICLLIGLRRGFEILLPKPPHPPDTSSTPTTTTLASERPI
jgi:hypothetical protein